MIIIGCTLLSSSFIPANARLYIYIEKHVIRGVSLDNGGSKQRLKWILFADSTEQPKKPSKRQASRRHRSTMARNVAFYVRFVEFRNWVLIH